MNIIVAVDDKNGMLFNHRRVSKDKEVRKKIAEIVQGNKLWMSQYSVSQYQDESYPFYVDDNFLFKAAKEEYCFVEDRGLSDVKECIDGMIIFRWNRTYPSDFKLDILPEDCGFVCLHTEDFVGNSHDKITMEIWRKQN